MITYKFTAPAEDLCKIFKAKSENISKFVEVPLRLLIPFETVQMWGSDTLQKGIEDAIEEMIEKLNRISS